MLFGNTYQKNLSSFNFCVVYANTLDSHVSAFSSVSCLWHTKNLPTCFLHISCISFRAMRPISSSIKLFAFLSGWAHTVIVVYLGCTLRKFGHVIYDWFHEFMVYTGSLNSTFCCVLFFVFFCDFLCFSLPLPLSLYLFFSFPLSVSLSLTLSPFLSSSRFLSLPYSLPPFPLFLLVFSCLSLMLLSSRNPSSSTFNNNNRRQCTVCTAYTLYVSEWIRNRDYFIEYVNFCCIFH